MDKFARGRPIDILLVEDNPGDVRLTREALKDSKISNTLHVATTGEAALDFLAKRGKYESGITPDIVLLDLNLPRMSGREVLVKIKEDPELRRLPVVILTTSSSPDDIATTYGNYANCFITKSVDLDRFITIIRSIEDFWLSIVKLPRVENESA